MDLFWHEVGYSSGQSDAKHQYSRKLQGAYADIESLLNKVRALEADLAVVEPNRDDLARQAWELHYELEQAKKDIDRLIQALNEARQETSERVAAERRSAEYGSLLGHRFLQDSVRYSRFLLALAEVGKSDRPEYEKFKAMIQELNDAWIEQAGVDRRDDPAFQQRLHELVESLRC